MLCTFFSCIKRQESQGEMSVVQEELFHLENASLNAKTSNLETCAFVHGSNTRFMSESLMKFIASFVVLLEISG